MGKGKNKKGALKTLIWNNERQKERKKEAAPLALFIWAACVARKQMRVSMVGLTKDRKETKQNCVCVFHKGS